MKYPITEYEDACNRFCWKSGEMHTTPESHPCDSYGPRTGFRVCQFALIKSTWALRNWNVWEEWLADHNISDQ